MLFGQEGHPRQDRGLGVGRLDVVRRVGGERPDVEDPVHARKCLLEVLPVLRRQPRGEGGPRQREVQEGVRGQVSVAVHDAEGRRQRHSGFPARGGVLRAEAEHCVGIRQSRGERDVEVGLELHVRVPEAVREGLNGLSGVLLGRQGKPQRQGEFGVQEALVPRREGKALPRGLLGVPKVRRVRVDGLSSAEVEKVGTGLLSRNRLPWLSVPQERRRHVGCADGLVRALAPQAALHAGVEDLGQCEGGPSLKDVVSSSGQRQFLPGLEQKLFRRLELGEARPVIVEGPVEVDSGLVDAQLGAERPEGFRGLPRLGLVQHLLVLRLRHGRVVPAPFQQESVGDLQRLLQHRLSLGGPPRLDALEARDALLKVLHQRDAHQGAGVLRGEAAPHEAEDPQTQEQDRGGPRGAPEGPRRNPVPKAQEARREDQKSDQGEPGVEAAQDDGQLRVDRQEGGGAQVPLPVRHAVPKLREGVLEPSKCRPPRLSLVRNVPAMRRPVPRESNRPHRLILVRKVHDEAQQLFLLLRAHLRLPGLPVVVRSPRLVHRLLPEAADTMFILRGDFLPLVVVRTEDRTLQIVLGLPIHQDVEDAVAVYGRSLRLVRAGLQSPPPVRRGGLPDRLQAARYRRVVPVHHRGDVFRRPISSLVRAICDEGAAVIELEFTVELIAYLFEPRPPGRVVVEEGGVPLLRLFLLESGVVLLVGVHAAPNDRSSLHPFAAVFSYLADLFRAQTERSLRHLKDLLEIFTPVSP